MDQIGRPVRIVSLSFQPRPLAEIVPVVEREAAQGVDLIALPETFLGQDASPEPLDGPTVTTLAELARVHRTYVVCPIYRDAGGRRLNSAVLLDRSGDVVGVYDKVYPYWSEFDLRPAADIGDWSEVAAYETDFGTVGLATCFDVNFPEVWQRLAGAGAELVIWPSAYSAGTALQAHALLHHFAIVSATWTGDCLVYDITGRRILDEWSDCINVSRVTLDLDRGIYHENFNLAKRDQLLREHADDVVQEVHLEREQWFVLRAARPGVSVRALARAYGLEELRDYVDRSRREIDLRRPTLAAIPG